jgi:hypothetical protein
VAGGDGGRTILDLNGGRQSGHGTTRARGIRAIELKAVIGRETTGLFGSFM